MVPLWKEYAVIQGMLAHNIGAIRYPDYHFFVGAYPNDQPTQDAVRAAAAQYSNVHLALCPHDGPTSKADCMNWIYQNIALYEEQTGEYFDILITHDAEDLIHPEELRWVNYYAESYDFIQIPVLALSTPFTALTHGVYCDEFAENHMRDMIVRSAFGCFIPGAGVGTGFRRQALEELAKASSNRVFEPVALTEDYENGLQLHRLGCKQIFVPLKHLSSTKNDFLATREYFPQKWYAAFRQRTRWVTGISLQAWERFGWRGTPSELYWLWRDRKGLVGSPLGVVANAVFFYGVATGLWTRMPQSHLRLAGATLALQVVRILVRMACVSRVYGILFSLGVPIRIFWANFLNAAATLSALYRYAHAKYQGKPLRWLKTEHAYPNRTALLSHRRRLGEILIGSGVITPTDLSEALANCPAGAKIGEYLLRCGRLAESTLYEALSLQQGLPLVELEPKNISRQAVRILPARVTAEWRVLPFRLEDRSLFIAGSELPRPEMNEALRSFTSFEIRFHLVTPTTFERLTSVLD
jgi:bacteriophage N4 adsorption protein B